ncbi:139_t:CDS:10 [Diversispora eburnea]|uniref:139_t:CDS:1 n=1 Tax=Diversispora eburnea TaxID=1213867 RepID=A0A9N8WN90_9GLOM|nr:139_t:CDS:10 [Diversispora eburnea]
MDLFLNSDSQVELLAILISSKRNISLRLKSVSYDCFEGKLSPPIGQFISLQDLYIKDCYGLHESGSLILTSPEQGITIFNNNFNELRRFSFDCGKGLDANELLCTISENGGVVKEEEIRNLAGLRIERMRQASRLLPFKSETITFAVEPRYQHNSLLVGNNLFLLGGLSETSGTEKEMFFIDLTKSFKANNPPWEDITSYSPIPIDFYHGTSISVNASTIYIFGGEGNNKNNSNFVYRFSIESEGQTVSWNDQLETTGTLPSTNRYGISSAFDPSTGDIYIFGGKSIDEKENPIFHNDLFKFNYNQLTWEIMSNDSSPTKRYDYTSTMVRGYIFYIGGIEQDDKNSTRFVDINKVYIYNTNDDTWGDYLTSGDKIGNRTGHSASATSDDNIIIYGGSESIDSLTAVQPLLAVLDVVNLKWSAPSVIISNGMGEDLPALAYHSAVIRGDYMIISYGAIGIWYYYRKKKKSDDNDTLSKDSSSDNNVRRNYNDTNTMSILSDKSTLSTKSRTIDYDESTIVARTTTIAVDKGDAHEVSVQNQDQTDYSYQPQQYISGSESQTDQTPSPNNPNQIYHPIPNIPIPNLSYPSQQYISGSGSQIDQPPSPTTLNPNNPNQIYPPISNIPNLSYTPSPTPHINLTYNPTIPNPNVSYTPRNTNPVITYNYAAVPIQHIPNVSDMTQDPSQDSSRGTPLIPQDSTNNSSNTSPNILLSQPFNPDNNPGSNPESNPESNPDIDFNN